MSDRLKSSLESLHHHVEWPVDESDFTWSAQGLAPRTPRAAGFRRAAVAVASVAVVALILIVSPQARQAVAGLLEAAGIKISISEEPVEAGALLDLGRPVSLDEAQEGVRFTVRVPTGLLPGAPDGIYLGEDDQVTMVWRGDSTLPAAGATGVSILFSQWSSDPVSYAGIKTVTPEETSIVPVLVEGSAGLWIEGASHSLTLFDGEGNMLIESTRLAANVLLWNLDGVNHRIETTGTLDETLAIAAALLPAES